MCGSITPEVWPNVTKLDLYRNMQLPENKNRKIKERLRHFVRDSHALDLLDKLFILDPSKRANAEDALDHDFFWTGQEPAENLNETLAKLKSSNFDMFSNRSHRRYNANQSGASNISHSKVFWLFTFTKPCWQRRFLITQRVIYLIFRFEQIL